MKNFVLLAAFALLVAALPASAAEVPPAPAAANLEQIFGGADTPKEMGRPPLEIVPFCWQVQGTTCTTVGATRPCTDVCNNNLSCSCTYYYSNPSFRFWNCDYEC
jgi:transcriptional regulator of nitric oxide reductase